MTAPTDQRAGVKPIAFALDYNGAISVPITLQIRPEDLTRMEPSRSAVHQTLGREVSGWVDHFGPGLPTINISGHTGWRTAAGSGLDGAQAFVALNDLVVVKYHAAKQLAIDSGIDPAFVKLIYVDMLDGFAWSVVPMQFSLKRNKQRPLLMQYSIAMQTVSTNIDPVAVLLPNTGNPSNGLLSLGRSISNLQGYGASIVGTVGEVASPALATLVGGFFDVADNAFRSVIDAVKTVSDLSTNAANRLIGYASSIASVGVNLFRALNAIQGIAARVSAQISRVAAAFNEVVCIFANSLKPRPVYEQYAGLYGASNCSSTVGGRPSSPYSSLNVLSLISERDGASTLGSAGMAGVAAIKGMDPVLAPMPTAELERHMGAIVSGSS